MNLISRLSGPDRLDNWKNKERIIEKLLTGRGVRATKEGGDLNMVCPRTDIYVTLVVLSFSPKALPRCGPSIFTSIGRAI